MSETEVNKLQQVIYWIRAVLGILLGTAYAIFWRQSWGSFLTAVSFSLLFYLLSYYLIRMILGEYRVELLGGSSNVLRIGIGMFFLSFIFFWILIYSLFFHTG